MNHQEAEEHEAVQISQLYTELYIQMVPQQGLQLYFFFFFFW